MVIKELIVHLIEKQADTRFSNLSLSREPVVTSSATSSGTLERFLDELNKIYNSRATKVFGAFTEQETAGAQKTAGASDTGTESDEEKSMKIILETYLEQQGSFVDYSHQAMNLLKHYIEQAGKATGGYVVFAHYTLFGSDFMLIAMLNNVSGIAVDDKLEINNIDYLDISKLHLAARIDLTQWQEDKTSKRYISMVRTKESHKLSEYFRQFIGSDEISDSKKETSELFTAIGQFCDNKFDKDEEKSEFKQKASDYCLDQAEKGQNVNLNDFSNYVAEGAVEDFMKYVNSEQFALNTEVSPNKSVIRRFNKITGRNAQMSITINEEALGDSVIYDADKETLTLTDLPAALKAQLLER